MAKSKPNNDSSIIWFVIAFCLAPTVFGWTDRVGLKVREIGRYGIGWSSVRIDPKPKDCDWSHAPIGDKACRYDPEDHSVPDVNNKVTEVYVMWAKVQE